MEICFPNQNLGQFLHFLAIKKREFHQWRYFHVSLDRADTAVLPVEEIAQFLCFYFQKDMPVVLKIPESNQMILLMTKRHLLALNKFEKGMLEQFKDLRIRTEVRGFDHNGLEAFIKIIGTHVIAGDPIQRTLLTRLNRVANRIMIVDDDTETSKKLEKVLSGFGYVVVMNKVQGFLEQYMEYAPDVLFLGIHLKAARSNEMLRNLIKRVDPYAHVVMIGEQADQKTILDVKESGAKGFIVKPFSQNVIFQQVARVPTLVLRRG